VLVGVTGGRRALLEFVIQWMWMRTFVDVRGPAPPLSIDARRQQPASDRARDYRSNQR
jgi:hypothetical protein